MALPPGRPESDQAIAYRLKLTRIALGYSTIREWSEWLGVEETRWGNYENAVRRIPHDVTVMIYRRYPVITPNWIYLGIPMEPRMMEKIEAAEAALSQARPVKRRRGQAA